MDLLFTDGGRSRLDEMRPSPLLFMRVTWSSDTSPCDAGQLLARCTQWPAMSVRFRTRFCRRPVRCRACPDARTHSERHAQRLAALRAKVRHRTDVDRERWHNSFIQSNLLAVCLPHRNLADDSIPHRIPWETNHEAHIHTIPTPTRTCARSGAISRHSHARRTGRCRNARATSGRRACRDSSGPYPCRHTDQQPSHEASDHGCSGIPLATSRAGHARQRQHDGFTQAGSYC